jgi:hypothetical protein
LERSDVAADSRHDLEGSSSTSKRTARIGRGVKPAGAKAALLGSDQSDDVQSTRAAAFAHAAGGLGSASESVPGAAAAGAAADRDQGGMEHLRVTAPAVQPPQQQQKQQSSRKKAEGRTKAAGASLTGQSLGQASAVGQADEAVRASIRRVERAALLEKIKLLQQHHQGHTPSQG